MERLYTCACPVCAKSEGGDGDIHLSEEELEAISATPEFEQMAEYPYYGSVKMIGDYIVVKLG